MTLKRVYKYKNLVCSTADIKILSKENDIYFRSWSVIYQLKCRIKQMYERTYDVTGSVNSVKHFKLKSRNKESYVLHNILLGISRSWNVDNLSEISQFHRLSGMFCVQYFTEKKSAVLPS